MKKKLNLYNIFIHIMLVALLIIVGLLIKQNKDLKAGDGDYPIAQEGDNVVKVDIKTFNDADSTISFNDQKKLLLFIMSSSCEHCVKNMPNWNEIYNRFNKKYKIVGLMVGNTDDINTAIGQYKISYSLFRVESNSLRKNINVYQVPQTVLISNNKIEKIWSGALNENTLNGAIEVL